jgi:hypothetical protein
VATFWPPGSGSTSQRYGSGSTNHPAKIVRKNLDSYCFVTSFGLFIFEDDVNVPTASAPKYLQNMSEFEGTHGAQQIR